LNNPARANEIAARSRLKNRSKCNARAKAWYLKNAAYAKQKMADRRKRFPQKIKDEKLRAAFGIGMEQYERIAKAQKYRCAICTRHQDHQTKNLAVDHDHQSGKIRGLLCHNCNVGLGNFKDSTVNLKSAIRYLNEYTR
jgi:hypothetical protein